MISCVSCQRTFSSLTGSIQSFDHHLHRAHGGPLGAASTPSKTIPTPVVYWIREYGQTDPYTQGYIGITTHGLSKRCKQHKKKGNAAGNILKNGGLVSVLYEGTEDAVVNMEKHYRPRPHIGDNIATGGSALAPPSRYSFRSKSPYA